MPTPEQLRRHLSTITRSYYRQAMPLERLHDIRDLLEGGPGFNWQGQEKELITEPLEALVKEQVRQQEEAKQLLEKLL